MEEYNMKITRKMVMELNNELAVKGCPFRYKLQFMGNEFTSVMITLPNMNCVDSFVINVTEEFYEWLDMWFKTKYNIELNYNNTGSAFWSKEN